MNTSSPRFAVARLLATPCLAIAAICTSVMSAHAVTIDWVTVGDPGNVVDNTGYGSVATAYRIGKYEITVGQYAEFLNAKAKSDPYWDLNVGLWNSNMETNLNVAGIARSGVEGSYSYAVIGPSGLTPAGADSPSNRPITYVSWFDAARYANWLHNGQGTGSTETGAYTLNGAVYGTPPARNPGALFWIPSEHEWYKAAYYKGSGTNAGYWDFAMRSNSSIYAYEKPGNTIGPGTNQGNYMGPYSSTYAVTQSGSYSASQNYLTNVGAFSNNASAYGTFDQSGNVAEWIDAAGANASSRRFRGGAWNSNANDMESIARVSDYASSEYSSLGFRLASPVAVPEPSTWVMGLAGIACAGWHVTRRRKR